MDLKHDLVKNFLGGVVVVDSNEWYNRCCMSLFNRYSICSTYIHVQRLLQYGHRCKNKGLTPIVTFLLLQLKVVVSVGPFKDVAKSPFKDGVFITEFFVCFGCFRQSSDKIDIRINT